jgi:DNA-binding transcriptional LysR family regulator
MPFNLPERLGQMELRQLEHFVAVAEERSFTRAAQRMNIVQSGLSMSIRALEQEVGTKLFDRNTRGVVLTPSGEAMLPEARRAIAAVESARVAVDATQGLLRGNLTVGLPQASPDGARFARLLGEFHAKHPGVTIRVSQGNAGTLFDAVHAGRVDLVVVGRPLVLSDAITTIPLVRADFVLACHATHPLAAAPCVSLSALAHEPFIDFQQGWVSRQYTDNAFALAGQKRTIVCEVDDALLVLQMVEQGLGVAIVPRVAQQIVPDIAYVPLDPPMPEWQLVVGFAGEQPSNVAARVFLGMVTREWSNG